MPKAKNPAKKAAKKVAAKDRAAQNAAALAALETMRDQIPWAFAENGKGDFMPETVICALRGLDASPDRGKRYRFDWAGSQNAFGALRVPTVATLAPRPDLSRDFEDTRNIFICGDNLETLKILRKAYAGRVKMIYIDPPYNTGGDFVYKDNFRDPLSQYLRETGQVDADGKPVRAAARAEERKVNGRKHSNWMSMMFPRLFIAREFLSDDGVIFISIDDNEVHHLRMLMNIVFGEDNFVGLITVNSNPRGSQASKFLAGVHEYVMAFCKSNQAVDIRGYAKTGDDEGEYDCVDEDGRRYRLLGLRQRGGAWKKEQREKLHYPIFVNPKNGEVSLKQTRLHTVKCVPKRPTGELGRWTWSPDKILQNPGIIVGKRVRRNGSVAWDIFRKDYFLGESGAPKSSKPKTIWDDREINYQNGRQEVKSLLDDGDVFDFPKPMHLMRKCLGMIDCEDGIVMDFFAGSATFAHAVMQMNAEDGGRRQCISVQLPKQTSEKDEAHRKGYRTIADIGMERLRRAGDKIQKSENGKILSTAADTGFRVYEMAQSAFRPWRGAEEQSKEKWEAAQKLALDSLPKKTDEDSLVVEVMLEEGYPLTSTIERVTAGANHVWRISDPDSAEDGTALHVFFGKETPDDLAVQLDLPLGARLVVRDKSLSDTAAVTQGTQTSLRAI